MQRDALGLTGQDVQPQFKESWRPHHKCGKGSKYADPLVIREDPASTIDLAILGDVGYRHIASVPKTLFQRCQAR
jgi:hypothetical protein